MDLTLPSQIAVTDFILNLLISSFHISCLVASNQTAFILTGCPWTIVVRSIVPIVIAKGLHILSKIYGTQRQHISSRGFTKSNLSTVNRALNEDKYLILTLHPTIDYMHCCG